MMRKRLLPAIIVAMATLSQGAIMTLQEGSDGYSGCSDRAVVDVYNFKKTDWLIAADSYSGNHRDPDQPGFAIAFFSC